MRKRVVVAVELDSSFVRLLNAECELSRFRERDKLTASQTLALAVLAEARGAYPEQVHAVIPPEWRGNIKVLHEHRKVTEEPPPVQVGS